MADPQHRLEHARHLLASGNTNWRHWERFELRNWSAKLNPHLGQWLIALPLPENLTQPPFDRLYKFGRSREHNQALGRIPSPPLLAAARLNVAVMGVGLCVLAAAIGWQLGGPVCATAAGLLIASSDLFVLFTTRAMTEQTEFPLLLAH